MSALQNLDPGHLPLVSPLACLHPVSSNHTDILAPIDTYPLCLVTGSGLCFKFHFPSSLPLLTYTLVFLPHSRQHANILSWKDFFPLTQEASFGLNAYCHYFYGLPTIWYWNCWIMDPILWTSHTFLEVTVSISISLKLHSMCWAYGRTFIWSTQMHFWMIRFLFHIFLFSY